MKNNDNRQLSPDAQAAIRLKVVSAILNGMTKIKAAEVFGVARSAIYKWLSDYEDGGKQNLQPQKRGPKNKAMKLQGWQAAQICNIILDRHPEQMKLPFALWNAHAVRDLITRKHEITYTVRYIQNIAKTLGLYSAKAKTTFKALG